MGALSNPRAADQHQISARSRIGARFGRSNLRPPQCPPVSSALLDLAEAWPLANRIGGEMLEELVAGASELLPS